jgi:nucleotide-binding universal stress UspA family protein
VNPLKSLLVAVDFSTGSRAALVQAARLARHTGAKLQVLHVVDAMAVAAIADRQEESYETRAATACKGAAEALERWLAQIGVEGQPEVTIAIGIPVNEILEHAQRFGADLIVAGVTGAGQAAAGAGLVAVKLARKVRIPILLVRPDQAEAFRRMVVGVDFSEGSKEAARVAGRWAVKEGGRVDFLHVWDDPWLVLAYAAPLAEAGMAPPGPTAEQRKDYIHHLEGKLHAFTQDAAPGIACAEVLHEASNACSGIVEYARECQADLIIVGGAGRTSLRDFLLGGTAERLLARLACSLLVVKAPPDADSSGNPKTADTPS